MNAGDAFRWSFGGHSWVVISDPALDPERVLVVNFTVYTHSARWQDPACVLEPGDHPFLSKRTSVFYAKARLFSRRELDGFRAAGRVRLFDPVSPRLLAAIHRGAALSERIASGYRQLLVDQGLISS